MSDYAVPSADFVTSALTAPMTAADTSASVATGLTIPAANGVLQIDYDSLLAVGAASGPETVVYASYNSGTGALSGLTRGAAGTVAVAHINTAPVQAAPSVLHFANLANLLTATAWTAWTPVFTGFSVDPTVIARSQSLGKTVFVSVYTLSNGTSNATTFTMTLPSAAANVANVQKAWAEVADNGGSAQTGKVETQQNSAVLNVYSTAAGGAWTAANGKRASFTLTYEKA